MLPIHTVRKSYAMRLKECVSECSLLIPQSRGGISSRQRANQRENYDPYALAHDWNSTGVYSRDWLKWTSHSDV